MQKTFLKPIVFISLILIASMGSLLAENAKSVKKAVLFSAVLPGTGQLYAGNQSKAGIFFATEAALWFGKTRFDAEKKWTENTYKKYAVTVAGADPNTSSSKFNVMQGYISSDAYNQEIILKARNYFLLVQNDPESYQQYLAENLYTGNETWDWQTEENRLQFKDMRNRRQKYIIYSNFAFSSLLINRLISVIDAAKTTKNYNRHHVYAIPEPDGKGITLNYEYRF